jgi:hypothetical protein
MRKVLSCAAIGLVCVFMAQVRPEASLAAGAPTPSRDIDAVPLALGVDLIHVDGDLSEPAWQRAPAMSDFRQREPEEGAPATHPSDVRVLFDRTALYVAIEARDPEPNRIVGLRTRRDESSPSDWLSVLIDSYHDRRTAFEFGVNPAGVKYDQYWFNDGNNDRNWDAVWDVAVARSAAGWQAEFRIPLSQLRFRGHPDVVGFAVTRTVAHMRETSTWPLLPISASGYVSSFGALRGLTVDGSRKKLELMPYAVSEVTTAPVAVGDPLTQSPDAQLSAGVDLKYMVAPGLQLTGTINPDFGQVEADPAVVNLGAFETYFSERRPFFVEGSGNFSSNNLFYSRRIGRQPHRAIDVPDDGYASAPANSTILGAVKLTGRVGAWSVGALNAVTSAEHADIVSGPARLRATAAVEPTSSYSVARVSREFSDKSRVSLMLTSTNRKLTDGLGFLPASAVVGAVDGDWRLGHDRYSLQGFWIGSDVRGSTEAIADIQQSNVHSFQRPGATYLSFDPGRTDLRGGSGGLDFSKISGERTRFELNGGYRSPGYEVNDLGFQERADEIWQNAWWQLRNDRPGRHVRNWRLNFNQWGGWNFGGDRRSFGINVNAHTVLKNTWAFGSGFNVNAEGFDDRLTRGGPGGLVTGNINQWWYMEGDSRKPISLNHDGSWFKDHAHGFGWSANDGITIRPGTSIAAAIGINVSHTVNDSQWVDNPEVDGETHFVLARIAQTTVGLSTRVSYAIRPALTLQIYAQPFVSAGAYSGFKELVNGRAARYADRYAPFAYDGTPDFNFRSFRTTNVLRWEYRPGSVLFVVWQQGRQDTLSHGDLRFGRDFSGTFDAPATNVVLVKISRWLNF